MAAHDGRIYRVFFPPGEEGKLCPMHGIWVDRFRLKEWFPEIEPGVLHAFNLQYLILQKADGQEIKIEVDQAFVAG